VSTNPRPATPSPGRTPARPSCRGPLTARNFGLDHATPTSRGGGWGLDDLRVTCLRCNEIKGALTEDEFESLLALLATWPDEARRGTLARLRAGGRVGR